MRRSKKRTAKYQILFQPSSFLQTISLLFGTKFQPIFVVRKKKTRKKVSAKWEKRIRYSKVTTHRIKKLRISFIRDVRSLLKRKQRRIYSKKTSRSKTIGVVIFSVCILLSFAGWLFYIYIIKDLPSPNDLSSRELAVSTKIYDRNGMLLYNIHGNENRTPVTLSSVPSQMKLATLASEDALFYEHPGFSLRGIIRSLKINWEKGTLIGGSTITQQLVKNRLLSSEKTFTRKLKEVTLAILVERIYSKDEILEMYLNEVPFGGTAYGVQEAAQTFFGKNIEDLNLSESALLAGLPKSPSYYSPYGDNRERAIQRQHQVLSLMETHTFITKEQRIIAEETELTFTDQTKNIKAPHFVVFVRNILEERYGKDMVLHGGLSVTTSLDYDIQKLAENVVSEEVSKLQKLHVTNGAALVLSPQTGEILAMVGSKDYFDTTEGGNVNVTTRLRQPGSSIKVINYAYALSHGFTPQSMLEDTPITFLVDGQEPYTPKNYENGFRGRITLRSALAESRNIPAVKLLYANGIENMIALGQKMGITSWNNPKNYGLSLTLGGGEVRLLDLAQVYATVANYGERPPLQPILKVTDYKGSILDENICDSIPLCHSTPVLDPRVAFQLTDILKDNIARAPSFGTNSLLVIPKHPEVAVKTGTSNNLRDNLAVGYTKDYLVAVWVGNNDNSPMGRIASGITGATPIWNKIMAPLISEKESYEWTVPEGMKKFLVCGRKEEWFLEESVISVSCFERKNQTQVQKPIVGDPNTPITPTPKWIREVVDLRNPHIRLPQP